ncbi:Grx4 family monothiol glutaredoxin [Candidatus Woesearchaeota archaeon]|jgi:Grx4 family monothiol glutaredoxin|nr:Grx4 family monothiol glutaredoxin [Candidatus Woesearchaeota archaeon]MBT5740601.1 Grx4 family monothiol glutaredoxin [Candidatus Woesearchaeota archaeon]
MNEQLKQEIQELINSDKVFLFMKGTPEQPRCGFSWRVVQALKEAKIEFSSFDILSNEDIRSGVKEFSSWPTFPQLYANSKLIGGCDIIEQLSEEDKLNF